MASPGAKPIYWPPVIGLLRKLTGLGGEPRDIITLRPRDCHTHVIPCVDDGSRAMEESLAMLRLLRKEGARRVIATSHIFPGRFDNEPDDLKRRFEELERAREEAGIAVELELGAEHYCDEHLVDRIARDAVLSFGPERYVLFETHTGEYTPPQLLDVVYGLADKGYTPLIAHVERYRYLRDEQGWELCEDLRSAGAKFQVNRTVGKANVPGRGPRGMFIARLLERGWVDEVGSDLHRPTKDGRPYPMDNAA